MNEPLTEREIEILHLIADGLANGEIAAKLSLSLHTVKWYSRRIYEKLAVSNRTQAIQRAQRLGLLGGASISAAPPVAAPAFDNLPLVLTVLVGRRHEIDTVKQLLNQHRLLTLTGPGGIGKTRLAIQVAQELSTHFHDGLCFVDLSALNETDLVINTIAQRLGVAEAPDRSLVDMLHTTLSSKQFLLILDNFEHLLPAAPLVADLLAATHALTVLVTSREPLALYGEQEYPVPPLQMPDLERFAINQPGQAGWRDSEALQLFERCAQAVVPGFRLNAENIHAVASLCLRLDGLPLAIELAAAYVKLLTPQAMLTQLDSLWLEMKRSIRNIPTRQQTLRNTIEWSYRFLNATERDLFAQLAIFRGGCTWDTIQAICIAPTPLALLEALNGLVWRRADGAGQPRFGMLETIREYAASCLQALVERETLRQRHAQYYAGLVAGLGERLYSTESKAALAQLNGIADNVAGAWHWFLQSVGTSGNHSQTAHWLAQLIPTLAEGYYMEARFQEGKQRFGQAAELLQKAGWDAALASPAAAPSLEATVFAQLQLRIGMLSYELSQYEAAQQTIMATLPSLQTWNYTEELALALRILGKVHYRHGQREQARIDLQRSYQYAQSASTRLGQAAALNNLSHLAQDDGNYAESERLLRECLALYEQMNYPFGIGTTLGNLGHLYTLQGKFAEALPYLHSSLAIAEQEEDIVSKLINLSNIADAELAQGRRPSAMTHYQQSRTLAQEVGQFHWVIVNLNGLSQCHLVAGDLLSAIDRLTEALTFVHKAASAPAVLTTISLCGQLLAQQGHLETALQLLVFVVQHPATTVSTKAVVQQGLARLAQTTPPSLVEQAQQWAATQRLDTVLVWVQTLLADALAE